MKQGLWLALICLACGSALKAGESADKFLSKRSVEIEWDAVPEATQYDLEIYDGKYKKFIKTFSSKTNVFKLNVKMGRYYFRSRILDKFERSSEWTDLAELTIAPPPTKITSKIPSETQLFADKKTGLYEMPLAWESLPGIEEYKILLESPDGKVSKEFQIKNNSAMVKVPPGQYSFRIQAILADGTIGESSEATAPISVLGAQIQKPTVLIRKSKEKGPTVMFSSELNSAVFAGELYYMSLEGVSWQKVKEYSELNEKFLILDSSFNPGQYRIRLQAKYKGFTPSEFTEAEFVLKPYEVALLPITEQASSLTKVSNTKTQTGK